MKQSHQGIVRQHIDKIVTTVVKEWGENNIKAIYLYGSGARGELTFTREPEVHLMSDYEILVVTGTYRKRRSPSVTELSRICEQRLLDESYDVNIEIHQNTVVEFLIKPLLNKTVAEYEFEETAIVLYGRDLREQQLGGVTIDTLDFGDLNTLILERLFKQLRLSVRLADDETFDIDIFRYGIIRNLVEIPTIFLPHIGILKCSYRARSKAFSEHAPEDVFSDRVVEAVVEASETKVEGGVEVWSVARYRRLVEGYCQLALFLMGKEYSRGWSLSELVEKTVVSLLLGQGLSYEDSMYRRVRLLLSQGFKTKVRGIGQRRRYKEVRDEITAILLVENARFACRVGSLVTGQGMRPSDRGGSENSRVNEATWRSACFATGKEIVRYLEAIDYR